MSSSPSSSPPFNFELHTNYHGAEIWMDEKERSLLWPNEAVLLSVLTFNNADEPDVSLLNTFGRILSMLPEEILIQPRLIRLPHATPGHQWGFRFKHLHYYLEDMNRPDAFPSQASLTDCTSFLNFAYSGMSTKALREVLLLYSSSSSSSSSSVLGRAEFPTSRALDLLAMSRSGNQKGSVRRTISLLKSVFKEQLQKHHIRPEKLQKRPQFDVFCACLGFSGSFVHALAYYCLNQSRGGGASSSSSKKQKGTPTSGEKEEEEIENPIPFHIKPNVIEEISNHNYLLALARAGHLKSGTSCISKPLLAVDEPHARYVPFIRLLETAGFHYFDPASCSAEELTMSNPHDRRVDKLITSFLAARDFDFLVHSPFMTSGPDGGLLVQKFSREDPIVSSLFEARIPVRPYLEEVLDSIRAANGGGKSDIQLVHLLPNGWFNSIVSLAGPIPAEYWKEVGDFLRGRGDLIVILKAFSNTTNTGGEKILIEPMREENKVFLETILLPEELEQVELKLNYFFWDSCLPRYQKGERFGEFAPGLNLELMRHYLKDRSGWDSLPSYFKACPEEGKRREIVLEVVKNISFTKLELKYITERIGDFLDLSVVDDEGRNLLALVRSRAAERIQHMKDKYAEDHMKKCVLEVEMCLEEFEKWFEVNSMKICESTEGILLPL